METLCISIEASPVRVSQRKVHVSARQIVATLPQVAPRLPALDRARFFFLQPPPVRARTVCCLLKIAPEPEPAGGLPAVVWATSFSFSAPGWSCGTPGEAGEREKVASISIRPTSLCAYKVLDQRGEKHEAVYRILPHT